MRLTLKPFGPVDAKVLDHLKEEIPDFEEIVVAPAAALPAKAFNRKRGPHGQYLASSLFDLCAAEPGARVLGVTDVDLYEAGLNFVFGFSQPDGRVAVISLARLHDREPALFHERCVKEAVHEIGHTLGLPHDEERSSCVMHFSRTLEDTDHKGRAYCPACASRAQLTLSRLRT